METYKKWLVAAGIAAISTLYSLHKAASGEYSEYIQHYTDEVIEETPLSHGINALICAALFSYFIYRSIKAYNSKE